MAHEDKSQPTDKVYTREELEKEFLKTRKQAKLDLYLWNKLYPEREKNNV